MNLKLISTYALYCLIEALHEDVDDGVPGAQQALNACQTVVRERNLTDATRCACGIYPVRSPWLWYLRRYYSQDAGSGACQCARSCKRIQA